MCTIGKTSCPPSWWGLGFTVSCILAMTYFYLVSMIAYPGRWVDVRGWVAGGAFVLLAYLVVSLVLCVTSDPGRVPEYLHVREDQSHAMLSAAQRMHLLHLPAHTAKANGCRRFCRYCRCYKPDRTHHCHDCRRCVLKLDHHCVFLYNCIGFYNYKFFLLFLLACSVTSGYMALTLYTAQAHLPAYDKSLLHRASPTYLLTQVVATVLAVAFMLFFLGELAMLLNGYTTIEFAEKRGSRNRVGKLYQHRWNVSWWYNVAQVFGRNPAMWLTPVFTGLGNGLVFEPSAEFGGQVGASESSKED